jgi:hypothetical protein
MSSIEQIQEFEKKLEERLTLDDLKSLLIKFNIRHVYFGDIIFGLKYTLTNLSKKPPETGLGLRERHHLVACVRAKVYGENGIPFNRDDVRQFGNDSWDERTKEGKKLLSLHCHHHRPRKFYETLFNETFPVTVNGLDQ